MPKKRDIKNIFVIKASGKQEPFDPEKIKQTCIRAGATKKLAERIVEKVEERLYNGMPTREILDIALSILDIEKPNTAIRYDLKSAIMRLGPAGYRFEDFFAEILREYGYHTKVRQMVAGECVEHEIDIIAEHAVSSRLIERPTHARYMVELKYHNEQGIWTGLKETLYTYARYLDLLDGWKAGKCERFDGAWLVTNTKFSHDAIQYGICKGIKMLGWKYPIGYGIEVMIEKKRLYPITVLRNLRYSEVVAFSKAGILLVKDLFKYKPEQLNNMSRLGIKRIKEIIAAAEHVVS
mgnify:CR=1 FL=1